MTIDLSEFREPVREGNCAMQKVIDSLPEGETLRAAFAEAEITNASIRRWLVKRNVQIGITTISRHRKLECACAK
jgi:hypothetical protein